ncbi:MAG: sensor histidine kinase [Clostridia bacterium]|jgi:signal transduction histidine kinase|nr:sensor histidine kinase [Clostridia bacterium]
MKYLYDLILEHKNQIIGNTVERCLNDSYVCEIYVSEEISNHIIPSLSNIIFNLLLSQRCGAEKSLFISDLEEYKVSLNTGIIQTIRLRGAGVNRILVILKHYRNSINDIIYQEIEDKATFFKYFNMNLSFFDMLEKYLGIPLRTEEDGKLLQQDELNTKENTRILELERQVDENQKLLNEVIENERLRTEFLSNLSHELRTPLNVILGTIQLVDMYHSTACNSIVDKTKKYYKIMRQNCYRLLRLVNNIIDLNKLDAGYMHLNVENHDIVSIVSQISASVADYIENKGIDFVYCTKTDSKIIACDPDKIERILLNLLSNSIKFTDSGGKILVNLWDEDSKIFISVKDSGVGIPKEKQDLIFRRFMQIDKSLSRNHHGSGIGLSLVKSWIELHGGKISLISDGIKGTEFIVELPVKELTIMEVSNKQSEYSSNNKIEVINIEFSDIYS